jgi:hypothetical protein
MTGKTTRLQLYRMVNGVRTPCYLVLDQTLLVVEEGMATVPVAAPPPVRSPQAASIEEWFVREFDNPLPGSDALREAFFAEEAAAKERHLQENTPCPPCVLSSIMNRFRAKLQQEGFTK